MFEDQEDERLQSISARLKFSRELFTSLIGWIEARIATTIRKGVELLPPDVEEIRILARLDQEKAQILTDIDWCLASPSVDPERKEKLQEVRDFVVTIGSTVTLRPDKETVDNALGKE